VWLAAGVCADTRRSCSTASPGSNCPPSPGCPSGKFYFRFFPGAIRSAQIIEFLAALKRQIKRPLLIIWDGVATHRSHKLKAWLEDQNGQIAAARLPPYAPELNPVEAIWACLNKHEIANLCLNTIGEVGHYARNRLKSMQRRPNLVTAFSKQAELAF
jgi:transposase